MRNVPIHPGRRTPEYMPSIYGNTPDMRASELPFMTSINMKDLFPSLPEPIYQDDNDDLSKVIKSTEEALARIDMSDIKPNTSVNICCAEHGFAICGGKPYLEMLKTIKRVVVERTGCVDVRLRVVMYRTPKEGKEVIDYYHLREEFDNNVESACAYDKAVPIDTRIGRFWGIEKAYDADKFIYAYYDDPRELYLHRMYRKSFKAFTMNMARFETRSIFHKNMGQMMMDGGVPDIIPTSIFDSDFVQSKYSFSCFLRSSPAGIYCVDADRDLYALDDRIMKSSLKNYAYAYRLIQSCQDFNMIIDGGRWAWYMAGGGIISGALVFGYKDFFDLNDNTPPTRTPAHPGVKAAIINQCWIGLGFQLPAFVPTYIVGDELVDLFNEDPMNKTTMKYPFARTAETLPEAVEKCKEISGNDKFIVFDGSFGFVNCSESMAKEMMEKAPEVEKLVNEELYPKYMKQRGLSLDD